MLSRPKSTASIRNSNFKFNFNSNNNSNLLKLDNNNFSINQSPKLFSGKMRYMFEPKKLFSVADLNEKITNCKGPSLPIQFKRLTCEEIHNLFPNNYTKRNDILNKFKYTSIKGTLLERIIKPDENKKEANNINTKKEQDKNNEKKTYEINITDKGINPEESKTKMAQINQKDINNNERKEVIIAKETEENKSKKEEKEIIKRPNTSIFAYKQKQKNIINTEDVKVNNIVKEEKIYNIKNDIWKPANYKDYEESVKDRKFFFQKMKENPFFNRLPSCTLKEIQDKTYNTDIFFVKPPKSSSKFNNFKNYMNNIKNQKNNCYFNSDILNIKNDELSLKKIGEKYLFQIPQNVKYTSSRESNSEWKTNIPGNSINNCSSKDYNILTPNRINNNMTREKVYKTLDNINYNKNNPISKQRSVSKFIDLANNKKSNLGIDYVNCFQTNPNCFKKVAEHCSSYGDLFLEYKNLCKIPFYKKSLTIE